MSKSSNTKGRTIRTTPTTATRAQKAVALTNGGVVPQGSYVGRLQRAADINFGKSGAKE